MYVYIFFMDSSITYIIVQTCRNSFLWELDITLYVII